MSVYQLFLWNVLLHSIQNQPFTYIIYHLIHSLKYILQCYKMCASINTFLWVNALYSFFFLFISFRFVLFLPSSLTVRFLTVISLLGINFMISFVLLDIRLFHSIRFFVFWVGFMLKVHLGFVRFFPSTFLLSFFFVYHLLGADVEWFVVLHFCQRDICLSVCVCLSWLWHKCHDRHPKLGKWQLQ